MSKKIIISNGVVLLIDNIPASNAVSVGLWLNIGSRDEKKHDHGISHFTEHMLFKGTRKRSYYNIAQEIDSAGGEINGATSKENTHYYVNITSEYFKKALDILIDMFFNSSFDKKEFDKERFVILDEIDMSVDDPGDYVFDIFARALWGSHPFGLPVIGEKEAIKKIRIEDLKHYYKNNYIAPAMIISAAGNVNEMELQRESEACLKQLNTENKVVYQKDNREKPESITRNVTVNRDIEQVYFICGRDGYSCRDENRFPMALLNMILGSSFSSRLFQKVREREGLCYSIGSSSASYSDVGEFTISFSTSVKNLPFILDAINNELKLIKSENISKEELENAKGRFWGSYVLAQEINEWKMVKMAVQEMMFGRLIPYNETLHKIKSITLEDLNRVAVDVLTGEKFSFASIGPEGKEKYLKGFKFSF